MAASDLHHKKVVQQFQDVIFKPRRAVAKSIDFSKADNMYKPRARNMINQTLIDSTAMAKFA